MQNNRYSITTNELVAGLIAKVTDTYNTCLVFRLPDRPSNGSLLTYGRIVFILKKPEFHTGVLETTYEFHGFRAPISDRDYAFSRI